MCVCVCVCVPNTHQHASHHSHTVNAPCDGNSKKHCANMRIKLYIQKKFKVERVKTSILVLHDGKLG